MELNGGTDEFLIKWIDWGTTFDPSEIYNYVKEVNN